MLAVVKMPHIKIMIEGHIPSALMHYLRREYGGKLQVRDDKAVDVFSTPWYRKMKKTTTPGDAVKIYRENRGWTQTELGKRLGGVSRHRISDWEHGRRMMSKSVAKKMALLFNVPLERFL